MTTAEEIKQLNDLEYFRLRGLPLDHPVRALWRAALASGWERPEPELRDPGVDRVLASGVDASEEW